MSWETPDSRLISEFFGNYCLEGRYLFAEGERKCNMLAIHGARTDYTRLDSLLLALQRKGLGSLSFNLSGHSGKSEIDNSQTSLFKNLQEALRFSKQLGENLEVVFGHSLGGALALKVAEVYESSLKTLILSCPALYPEEAYSVERYGVDFTRAISKPHGFLNSSSLHFLRRFQGRVILIVGQFDGLRAEEYGGLPGRSAGSVELIDGGEVKRVVYSPIPAEVFECIQHAAEGRISVVKLEGCDHKVFTHLLQYPMVLDAISTLIVQQVSLGVFQKSYRIGVNGHVDVA